MLIKECRVNQSLTANKGELVKTEPYLTTCRVYCIEFPNSVEVGHYSVGSLERWQSALRKVGATYTQQPHLITFFSSAEEDYEILYAKGHYPDTFSEYNRQSLAYVLSLRRAFLGSELRDLKYPYPSNVIVDYSGIKPNIRFERVPNSRLASQMPDRSVRK